MKKKSTKYILLAVASLILLSVIGQALGIIKPKNNQTAPAAQSTVVTDTNGTEPEEQESKENNKPEENTDSRISYGEVLDQTENEVEGKSICVLKVKIEPSLTKKMTIDQNYHNAVTFITEGGGDKYDSIDYWAVADMEDGSEGKVVSFTIPKETIDKIKDGSLVATQLKDYVEYLYILPSLQK